MAKSKSTKPHTNVSQPPEPRKPVEPAGIPMDIDLMIELILSGATYREMAVIFDVSLGSIYNFLAKDEHSARVSDALELSAHSYDDEALETLKTARSTIAGVAKAREIAQHLRWRAKVRNRRAYGDQVDLKHDVSANFAELLQDARKRADAARGE